MKEKYDTFNMFDLDFFFKRREVTSFIFTIFNAFFRIVVHKLKIFVICEGGILLTGCLILRVG